MQKRNQTFEVRMETIPAERQFAEVGAELDHALHTSFQHSDQRIRICKSSIEVLPILPEAFSVRQISPREKWRCSRRAIMTAAINAATGGHE
jgi:hypothetical protein